MPAVPPRWAGSRAHCCGRPVAGRGWRRVLTRVSHIDVFGNVQTPLPASTVQDLFDIPRDIHVWIADRSHKARLVRTYADLAPGDLGVLVSSSGHIEVAQRDGPAAVLLEARIGDEIALDAE